MTFMKTVIGDVPVVAHLKL